MWKKRLELVIKWLVYASFFVPLVVLPTSFIFPFIVPKILTFRSIVTVMGGLYVLLLIINWQEYRPRGTFLNWAVGSFLLSFALSTFFGVDSYHSFWDNHERMLGLFTIVHYVAYFFIASQVFKTWDEWRTALRVFLLAGSLVMFVGIIQIFNPNYLLNGGSDRIISTLGNAIYVGGYGMFLFFTASLLFMKDNNLAWRVFYGLGALMALIGMVYSGTRGTLGGLIIGLGVAMISYIFTLKDYPRIRTSLISIVIAGIVLIGLGYSFRNSRFIKDVPAFDRVFSTSVSDITGSARMLAWKAAIAGWKSKPVFGWGPNNFFYAFNTHYDPHSLEFGYGETWFDNAHNIILNTLAVQGTVGLVTYLAIFAAAFYMITMAYRERRVDMHFAIITAAFLVAHLAQNVTVFENPTSYLYFMFWLALVNQQTKKPLVSSEAKVKSTIPPDRQLSTSLAGAVILVMAAAVFVFDYQPARANSLTLTAMQMLSVDPTAALPNVESALHFSSPHIDDIRDDLSRTMVGVVADTSGKIPDETKKTMITDAEQALIANLQLHPLDIRIHLSLAQLYQTLALQQQNVSLMLEAQKYLELARQLSPHRQQVLYNLAIVDLQLGKSDEAYKWFNQAITDDPKIAESYIRLAYSYSVLGQPQKARETLDRAVQNGVVYSDSEQQTVNRIIVSLNTSTSTKAPTTKK